MIEELKGHVRELKRRVYMAVGRCVLEAVTDTTKCQTLKISLLDDELAEDVERFQEYGFTSVPFAGAEGIAVAVAGLRSHAVVIAVEDRRYRPTGLQPGEGGLYDDQAQTILIKRDGIHITTTKTVTVNAAEVGILSGNVNLGALGGKKVALDGDPVVGGVIVASSTKVKAV
ncbi:MAG TPA: phage baseplate assembly protein V [Caulobacteraceae bacterium]|nr:phage baseplate assembly protein V [Caulobacteraceae bacterium]